MAGVYRHGNVKCGRYPAKTIAGWIGRHSRIDPAIPCKDISICIYAMSRLLARRSTFFFLTVSS